MLERAKNVLGRGFRRSAMMAYAVNQSRARIVMDPIYLTVARTLLRGHDAPSARLAAEAFPANLFFPYRAQSRKLQYFIEDWDFGQARPDLLTPRQRQMMHTVALGETSGAAVSDGFLRVFRTDPELAAFFGVWFTEELNHFIGYHLYLARMGEAWPSERGLAVAETEVLTYSEDPMELAACNMYQELLGFLVYRSFARQVKDPFLKKMLAQFAKDECRHFRFYQDVVARHIQREPSFRAVVLKVFLKATSPYNQVSGGAAKVLDHLTMGAFYFRKAEFDYFLRQNEYLFGTDLRGFWSWYFRGVVAPCTSCGQEAIACACEAYDDDAPAAVKHPTWWRETGSTSGRSVPSMEEWAATLLRDRGTRAPMETSPPG
ncbi:MAG TPA: acyl-ACP desaturase [Kofleriaceae bacterium]|nr:acyl-ACP desaturase [Kofleriaceae bacterium]